MPLFIIGHDDKWGYIDQTGKTVIEPQFYWSGEFHEGLAQAYPDDYTLGGYIDQTGAMVIEAQFYDTGDFSEGLAPVRPEWGSRWGYIDRNGEMIIEPQFAEAYAFSEGLAQVRLDWDGPYGYIDRTGMVVIEPVSYYSDDRFSEGLALLQEDDTFGPMGFMDRTGRVVIEPEFSGAWPFADGLALVSKGSYEFSPYDLVDSGSEPDRSPLYGFVDTHGDVVVPVVLYDAWDFCGGLAPVQFVESGPWGFIDTKGKIAIAATFCCVGMFSEDGLAPVLVEDVDLWGYIDKTGELVIEPQFYDVLGFVDGLAAVCIDPDLGWGYIDTDGDFVYPTWEDLPEFYMEVDS